MCNRFKGELREINPFYKNKLVANIYDRIFGVATCLCKMRNQNDELAVLGPQVGTEPSVLAGAI